MPKSQLNFLTLFWGGSKWSGELLAGVGALWGRQKMKHPSLDAVSNMPRQRFPHLSPGPQPEKQVDPLGIPQSLQPWPVLPSWDVTWEGEDLEALWASYVSLQLL